MDRCSLRAHVPNLSYDEITQNIDHRTFPYSDILVVALCTTVRSFLIKAVANIFGDTVTYGASPFLKWT